MSFNKKLIKLFLPMSSGLLARFDTTKPLYEGECLVKISTSCLMCDSAYALSLVRKKNALMMGTREHEKWWKKETREKGKTGKTGKTQNKQTGREDS